MLFAFPTYQRSHARRFINGAAAAEERNQEDDRTEHNGQQRGYVQLLELFVRITDVAHLQDDRHAGGQYRNAA